MIRLRVTADRQRFGAVQGAAGAPRNTQLDAGILQ